MQNEIYSKKLCRGKRTYFFDIVKNEKQGYYLKISESKASSAGFEHFRILIMEEDLKEFALNFDQVFKKYLSLNANKSITKSQEQKAFDKPKI
jgi:ribonuclease HII